jgi:hypothetical protein
MPIFGEELSSVQDRPPNHPQPSKSQSTGAVILMLTGSLWALVGFGNIVFMPWTVWTSTALAVGMIFNATLFVLPGLVVYGIGKLVNNARAAA